MARQYGRADGRVSGNGKGRASGRLGGGGGGDDDDDSLLDQEIVVTTTAPPYKFPRTKRRPAPSGFDDGIDDVELAPSDYGYRSSVLASVGLCDDDGDDDELSDSDLDRLHPPQRKRKRDKRKKREKEKKREGSDQPEAEGDAEGDDDDADGAEEDDGLFDDEYESFDDRIDDEVESTWRDALRRILTRVLWIIVAVAAIAHVFYDDGLETSDVVDEGVVKKAEPYSYNGYKDARIPDDDVAQFGGGVIGGEAFGITEEEEDDDDAQRESSDDPSNAQHDEQGAFHEHTGMVEVDRLWEKLDPYAEMAQPYDPERDLPVFWHVPKCGGTTIQDLMSHCNGMVLANEVGGQYAKERGPPEVVTVDGTGNRYVNVDMTNPRGIAHARDVGFVRSGLADVVVTSYFVETASVFDDDEHRGRCFTMLRHPIKRAISLFYYLKDATWEHTYSEVYKNMTISQFAASQYAEDNWMVRFLSDAESGGVFDRHLDMAKEVLESKCLVGILDDFKASLKRFNLYFGWNDRDFGGPVSMSNRGTCVGRVVGHPDNAHSHPQHEEGSEVWNLLMEKNRFDMELYEHALHLFHDVQSKLVE